MFSRRPLAGKQMRFLGSSLLLSALLFAAGLQTATVPGMVILGIFSVLCALEFAFLMPFLWNRVFQYM